MKTMTLLLSLSLLLLTGCATWQQDGGKSLATVAVAVDSAMKGWATYCATHDVPQEEHSAVRGQYQVYQQAMSAASDAYQASIRLKDKSLWTQVSGSLMAAKDNLIAMVKEFTAKKEAL